MPSNKTHTNTPKRPSAKDRAAALKNAAPKRRKLAEAPVFDALHGEASSTLAELSRQYLTALDR